MPQRNFSWATVILLFDFELFIGKRIFDGPCFNPLHHCHRPITVRDEHATLGKIIPTLEVQSQRSDDDVIEKEIILFLGRPEAHHHRIVYSRAFVKGNSPDPGRRF